MLTPLSAQKWDSETAAHLRNRAAFGATPAEIEAVREKGLARSVDELIDIASDIATVPPPDLAHPRDIREARMGVRALKDDPEQRKEKLREIRMMESKEILD